MWGNCTCKHGPSSTHFWDASQYKRTWCLLCVECGLRESDHGPFGHAFDRCPCMRYQEAA